MEEGCSTATALAHLLDGLIQRSGIYSLDFDIEGAEIALPVPIERRIQAIKILQAKYPQLRVSYTVPVLAPQNQNNPGGLTGDGVNLIKQTLAAGVQIDVLNLMTMDYYFAPPAGITQGDLAIGAVQAVVSQLATLYPNKTEAQLYQMIGITPMIGQNDDGTHFSPNDAQKVAAFASNYQVARLSYWAFQRDQIGTGNLAIYSGDNTSNFQFYQIFSSKMSSPNPTPTPIVLPTPSPSPTPVVSPTPSPTPFPQSECPIWVEGKTYQIGQVVSDQGQNYTALLTHTAYVGAHWNPSQSPTLWKIGGTCGTPTPAPQTHSCSIWTLGITYTAGKVVSYLDQNYTARVTHTASDPNWNPVSAPSLWMSGGQCSIQ